MFAFLLSGPGRILGLFLAVLLAAGTLLGGVWTYGRSQYDQGYKAGSAAVAASLDAQGKQMAQAAETAREPALAPGAAARLLANFCRDCP